MKRVVDIALAKFVLTETDRWKTSVKGEYKIIDFLVISPNITSLIGYRFAPYQFIVERAHGDAKMVLNCFALLKYRN